MAQTFDSNVERLTLGRSLQYLGWYSLLLAAIGGLSIIGVLEAVFVDHDFHFVTPLRMVMDGYNNVMTVVWAMLKPLVEPILRSIGHQFHWRLRLGPIWWPIFALLLVWIMANMRASLREGFFEGSWVTVILLTLPNGLFALMGALACGLVPHAAIWWVQGTIAILPMVFMGIGGVFVMGIAAAIMGRQDAPKQIVNHVVSFVVYEAIAFALAAGLTLIPAIALGAGITAIVAFLASLGLLWTYVGMSSGDRYAARLGLTIIGGFVAAGLVLAADVAVKAIQGMA